MSHLSMCCTQGCLSFSPPKPPVMTPGVSQVWWHSTQGEGVTVAPTQTWCGVQPWGRADQLLQKWVSASLLPTQVTPVVPCSTLWVALPQSVHRVQGLGVGGLKGAWQRLCSGGAWGLTAWYLLGRQGTAAKVAVLALASLLALYRQAPKCRWCRREGCCVSRQGMEGYRVLTHPRLRLSIPVRQCGESGPPAPCKADNESAGLCLCRGSGHNGQRA